MKRKITDLALALSGMCGVFGASGLSVPALACSRWNREANASPPKPQQASERNSRRFRVMRMCSGILVHVQKCIQVENRESELPQRLGFQEFERELFFLRAGRPSRRQSIRQIR